MTHPVDMRRGFDGLHALVTQGLQRDLLAGDVFLFVSRTRKRVKALFWDGTGMCIYAKRLEQGRFAAPWAKDTEGPMEMTMSELALPARRAGGRADQEVVGRHRRGCARPSAAHCGTRGAARQAQPDVVLAVV